MLGSGGVENALQTGGPLPASRGDIHRKQLQGDICHFACWCGPLTPTAPGSEIRFSHRADGTLAGAAPPGRVLRRFNADSAWWCKQGWLLHDWHPAATKPALTMPCHGPPGQACNARRKTASFRSQSWESCLLHRFGERGRKSKGERHRERRRA